MNYTHPRGFASLALALSLFGTACSKDEGGTPSPEAGADVAADVGASDASVSCDLDAPFGAATLVDFRPSLDAGSIPLSGVLRVDAKDERFGAFDAVQGPATKIFVALRSGGSFVSADERVASTTVVHSSPALFGDGKDLLFVAPSAGKNAIFRAPADAKDLTEAAPWLTDAADLAMPYVASDDAVYAVRGGAAIRVPVTAKKAGTPTAVDGVPANVNGVVVDASETVLYYGRGSSFADAELHEMRKSGSTWTEKGAVTIGGLQKPETPSWLSADGCRLYVRGWPSPIDRVLYVAEKPKK